MPAIQCPQCGARFKAPDSAIGKSARCAKCQQKFVVQTPAADDPYELAASASLEIPARTGPAEDEYGLAPESTRTAALVEPVSPRVSAQPRTVLCEERPRPENAKSALPVWMIPAAIGGGLLGLLGLVLVCGIGASFIRLGGSGNPFGPSVVALPARDPLPGEYSWLPAAPLADAEPGWQVTPDGVALASGLKSAFPTLSQEVQLLLFSSPQGAKAATLHFAREQRAFEWVQYDLKATQPAGRVQLMKTEQFREPHPNLVAALSPAGDSLAMIDPFSGNQAVLFSSSGTETARFNLENLELAKIEGCKFAGDKRLLIQLADKVVGFALPEGTPAFEVTSNNSPGETDRQSARNRGGIAASSDTETITLSPGGKFLAALTEKGVEWFSTDDGQPAGVLPLPAEWFEPLSGRRVDENYAKQRIGGVTIDPSGKTVLAMVFGPHGEYHVAEWDVATGKARQAFVIPYLQVQDHLGTSAIWCNDRQLLLSTGHVLDLDLRTWLNRRYQIHHWPGQSPDGRFWRILYVRTKPDEVTKQLDPELAKPFEQTFSLLGAITIPGDAEREQLAQARQGFLWRPGMSLRAEIAGVPQEHQEKYQETLSEAIAKKGYRIDPDAQHTLKLTVEVKPVMTTGKTVERYGPNYEMVEVVPGFGGESQMSVVDDEGQPLFAMQNWSKYETVAENGKDAVWRELRGRQTDPRFPRLYARDAAGKRLAISLHDDNKYVPGIDGLFDLLPGSYSGYTPSDHHSLPTDGR